MNEGTNEWATPTTNQCIRSRARSCVCLRVDVLRCAYVFILFHWLCFKGIHCTIFFYIVMRKLPHVHFVRFVALHSTYMLFFLFSRLKFSTIQLYRSCVIDACILFCTIFRRCFFFAGSEPLPSLLLRVTVNMLVKNWLTTNKFPNQRDIVIVNHMLKKRPPHIFFDNKVNKKSVVL